MRPFERDDTPATPDPVDPGREADLGAEYEVFESAAGHEALLAELQEARRTSAESMELAQRKQADLENFRRRARTDQADAVAREGQRIVAELLPVLDNLERAVEHAVASGEAPELLKGAEMVLGQVLDVFTKEGVEIQDPLGGLFDPELHQAVQQRDDSSVPEGTVIEVFQKGYVVRGRVVRAAQVVVSAGGPAPEQG